MAYPDLSPRGQARLEKSKKYLRLFLQDTPALNLLKGAYESTEDDIDFAIQMAISDWNFTAPLLRPVTIENFPNLWALMHGSAVQVLKSQGLLQTRNKLNYTTAGSNFTRFDKGGDYQAWMINFAQELAVKTRNFKIAQNIASAYGGGVSSEYARIGYSW